MPLYDYECTQCGHTYFKHYSIKDRNNEKICLRCNGEVRRLVSMPAIEKDTAYKDQSGQKIWFPKDRKPYFDKALRRTFTTPKEKQDYMKAKNIVMDGSSNPKKWPAEAGDMRSREYRRKNRLED